MAFHEIDNVTDIKNGHRVIIYYIECKRNETDLNASKLCKALEDILTTLEKKNDDVLIVKVVRDSEQFTQFQQLYKADVMGQVTLFVVNNEGIPLISQHIYEKNNISAVLLSICNSCTLNPIPALDLDVKSESKLSCTITNDLITNKTESTSSSKSTESMSQSELRKVAKNICRLTGSNNTTMESLPRNENNSVGLPHSSTQLQIRLPDGSRHMQQFDKEDVLQEVWLFINTQFKLNSFDLKTFNRQNFSDHEYESTLKDLDLYPNGVLIVVPHAVSTNNNGWIGSMFHYGSYQLVSKTTKMFSYIQGLFSLFWIWARPWLFFSNNRSTGDNNLRRNQIQPTQNSNSNQLNSQRRSKSSKAPFGNNIHTLRRNDDSDDENNRYNGNSTQQK